MAVEYTRIHAPSCIRDLGQVRMSSGDEARAFEVRLKIVCPPGHNILDALADFKSLFYDQHPNKEPLPNEPADTIGGSPDTLSG